jgi:multidrug efflux system membrane fusion protein
MKSLLPLSVLVLGVLVLASCSGSRPAPANVMAERERAVPVKVSPVVARAEPVEIHAIGNVAPYATVQVKSEVGGELIGVGFVEGQEVQKGDLLLTIDPRPYQAALQQAEANRARDVAQQKNAEADAARYAKLLSEGVIAPQQYDQARSTADALTAAVKADEAAIENARVQLSYTKIYSPIGGRTGSLLVNRGNLIKANDVPIVVINQIRPIYVTFSVPSQDLPEIKRNMAKHALRVEASPKGSGLRGSIGELTFIDNTIDATTGTIQLKGTFQNNDRALWPGEFVDVTLVLTTQPNAVVVPSQAVQNGQQGQYVFVVKPDKTVESRPVVVDRTVGSDSVIASGLRPGETVVTDGQLRLVPGARVSVVPPGEAS